ncbi:hypothetical protein [Methylocystis heyeri]|uniref:Transmembrane protein n=1 Tax=Methylocystis heyeri TaxID=391905 RepID=A0A6B8KE58_9HYPH|nr:hypothetical protein [Methylocystis heyeri]QGM45967.1 hypothetical protein H2LOC_009780 [Methylocystis heyeri]
MSRSGKRIAAACLFLVGGVFAWLACNGGAYLVDITQQEAQERIDAALRQRAAESKNIDVESVKVRFADNQIGIDARVAARFKGRTITAEFEGWGAPIYRDGAFYFHPTSPVRLLDVGIEKPDGAKSSGLKQRIEKFAAEHGLDEVAESVKAEFRQWASAAAQKTVEKAFSLKPIYVLKDNAKGVVIKAALEKVDVVGDRLEITLSLVQFGYAMGISAACLLAAVALGFLSFGR